MSACHFAVLSEASTEMTVKLDVCVCVYWLYLNDADESMQVYEHIEIMGYKQE